MPRPEKKPRRGARARNPFTAWDGDGPTIDAPIAAACTDPQARAEYIAELMAGQRYVAHRTKRELLRVWTDIGPDRLTQICTQGAVLARASLGKCHELRTLAVVTMAMVRQQAIHHGEGQYRAGNPLAFKWYELAFQVSQGLLAFADGRFDRALARRKDHRDAKKHDRDMREGPRPDGGPAIVVIAHRGPVDEDGAPLADPCPKST